MEQKVFFSFHFENDVWRMNTIRNCLQKTGKFLMTGYIDATKWTEIKMQGDTSIKRWINNQLNDTSITILLIGSETSNRSYVKYELEQSWKRGNGMLGIYIHQLKGKYGETTPKGSDAFGPLFASESDQKKYFFERFKTYDWVEDDGDQNLENWIAQATESKNRR